MGVPGVGGGGEVEGHHLGEEVGVYFVEGVVVVVYFVEGEVGVCLLEVEVGVSGW